MAPIVHARLRDGWSPFSLTNGRLSLIVDVLIESSWSHALFSCVIHSLLS